MSRTQHKPHGWKTNNPGSLQVEGKKPLEWSFIWLLFIDVSSGFSSRHSHHIFIFHWRENKCVLQQHSSFTQNLQPTKSWSNDLPHLSLCAGFVTICFYKDCFIKPFLSTWRQKLVDSIVLVRIRLNPLFVNGEAWLFWRKLSTVAMKAVWMK